MGISMKKIGNKPSTAKESKTRVKTRLKTEEKIVKELTGAKTDM